MTLRAENGGAREDHRTGAGREMQGRESLPEADAHGVWRIQLRAARAEQLV